VDVRPLGALIWITHPPQVIKQLLLILDPTWDSTPLTGLAVQHWVFPPAMLLDTSPAPYLRRIYLHHGLDLSLRRLRILPNIFRGVCSMQGMMSDFHRVEIQNSIHGTRIPSTHSMRIADHRWSTLGWQLVLMSASLLLQLAWLPHLLTAFWLARATLFSVISLTRTLQRLLESPSMTTKAFKRPWGAMVLKSIRSWVDISLIRFKTCQHRIELSLQLLLQILLLQVVIELLEPFIVLILDAPKPFIVSLTLIVISSLSTIKFSTSAQLPGALRISDKDTPELTR